MYQRERYAGAVCAVVAPAGESPALRDFLKHAHDAGDVAIVVLDRKTNLRPALQLEDIAALTALPVAEAAERKALKRGEVVLVSPQTQLDFNGGTLLATALSETDAARRGAVLTQDFDALARSFGAAAVGVVLDPSDVEARLALEAVRAQDGMTLLLDPGGDDTPDMEAARQMVDHEGDAATLMQALSAFARNLADNPTLGAELTAEELHEVCDIIREAVGHDFRHYKTTTLSRRILRRVGVLHCASFSDYSAYLRTRPEEVQTLMRDLLIGVTSFFRDADAFAALQKIALETLIRADATESVRIWVPGCATGQEAYSIAMLAIECAESCGSSQQIQIFATDLNERSLSVARRGTYPAKIAEEVTPDRLERFFQRTGRQWQVTRQVRQMVAFSPHNLIADPPLSRMDLICCRNLLIYLGAHLQKKLMSVFHYALRPNGYLFLGSSETVTGHGDLFHTVDARHRIAQRRDIPVQQRASVEAGSGMRSFGWQPAFAQASVDLGAITQRIVLDEFAPPYVIANESAQIVYLSPHADAFLQPPAGQYINSVLRMTRTDLRQGLRTAWTRAVRTRRTAVQDVHLAEGKRREVLRLTVQPMPELGQGETSFMVVFQALAHFEPNTEVSPATHSENEPLIEHLESELNRTRDELERLVQDFEAANEELKSSNEELLAMNEELYAANEELVASKEESEASALALERINADLVNLLSSTGIATIFLDGKGLIRRFTPEATRFYNLAGTDIGRPIGHFTHRFDRMDPLPEMADLSHDSAPITSEAHRLDGQVFLRRVTPYRIGNRVDGMVITFIDITEQHALNARLAASLADIEIIYRHAPTGMAQISTDMTFLRINDTLADINGLPAADHIGRPMAELLPSLAAQADAAVAEVLRSGAAVGPIQISGSTERDPLSVQSWLCTWAPVLGPDGAVASVLVSVSDVTEQEKQTSIARQSESRLRKTMDQVLAFVGVLSPDGILLEANEPAIRAAGVSRGDLIGKPFDECFWWQNSAANRSRLRRAITDAANGQRTRFDADIQTASGIITIDFQLGPYYDDDGRVVYLVPSGVIITDRLKAQADLQETVYRLEIALHAGTLGFFDWDIKTGKIDWNDLHFTLLGLEPGTVEPSAELWISTVHPGDVDRVIAAADEARRSNGPFAATYRVVKPSGQIALIECRASFRYDDYGAAVRMLGVVKDISALKAGEERLREIMGTSHVGIVLSRLDGVILDANHAARAILGVSPDAPIKDWAWRDHLDGTSLAAARRFTARLLRRGRVEPVEYAVTRPDGTQRPCLISAARIAGSLNECVTFIVDLSAQKKADAHRDLLVGELNHRVKNTLATIQAMASHTLRSTRDPEAFERAFKGRLKAIAIAHEILMGTDLGTVDLIRLIQRQVGLYAAVDSGQVRLSGPDIPLGPDVAHALGLVLHELTTNAAKYGALSCEGGVIRITWTTGREDATEMLFLTWEESGGPKVTRPSRSGFGSKLIQSSLSHSLNGATEINYRETGIVVKLRIAREIGNE